MSELRGIQQRMAAAVMQPLTRNESMRRRNATGALMENEAAAFVKPNDRLTSFERLEIYNRQYWFRLCSSFEEDFPGLQAIVGRRRFEKLMIEYLTDRPSASFSLRNLGSSLEQWLLTHPDSTAPRTALALDMARIEWAHIEAFDEASEPPLTSEDLAHVDGATQFALQAHVRLLRLSFPVDDLLIQVRNETGSSDTASNNAAVSRRSKIVRHARDLTPEEIYLAVHRRENSVYYKRLHREDFRMLQSIESGNTLEQAIEAGFADSAMSADEQVQFLRQAFQLWALLGWFAKRPA